MGCLKPSAGPSVPDVRLSGPPGNPNGPHAGRARAFCGRTGPSLVAVLLSGPALPLSTPQPCVFSGGSGHLGFSLCRSSQTRRFPKSPLCLAGTMWKVKLRPPYFIGGETEVRRVRRGARVSFSFKALRAAGALPTKCQVLIAKPLTGKPFNSVKRHLLHQFKSVAFRPVFPFRCRTLA